MSLRPRNGKWHWRFQFKGEPYHGSTGLDATPSNRKQAAAIEAAEWERLRRGERKDVVELKGFSDAADQFLSWCEVEHKGKPNTWKRIRGSFTSLKLYFGEKKVAGISSGDAQNFVTWRRSEHKVRDVTIRHDMHALSKFFQYAVKQKWTKGNVVDSDDIPSDADAVRINPLRPEDEAAYFKAARGYPKLWDLTRVMILQGCRPEEVLALELGDVDFEAGTFHIKEGKSAAAKRTLKMRKETSAILSRLSSKAVGRYLFGADRDARLKLSLSTCENWHNRTLEKSGVVCVIYDMRHTFASRAANAGMPLATLAKILGHGSLRSVFKYVHPDQEELNRAMDALDAG